MKKNVYNINNLIFLILLVSFCFLLAFKPSPDNEKEVTIKLPFRFPVKVNSIYKVTEKDKIKRILPDSSIDEYYREISYYISIFCPSFPEKGFQTLNVSVDSLTYKFSSKDQNVFFDSQIDSSYKNSNFSDLIPYNVPLGRTFEMIYSPYGEVAGIKGDDINWLKDYVLIDGKNTLDTLEKFIWLNGISFNRLAHIADVKKILFPASFIKEDSVWKSPVNFQVNKITLYDTAVCKITAKDKNAFIIEAELKNLKSLENATLLYNIKRFSEIKGVKGKSAFKIELHVKGIINKTIANVEAEIDYQAGYAGYLKEVYQTEIIWELLQQYMK